MVHNPLQYLPTAEELPDSDDIPVDNELQILIPTLLRAILALLWADRTDWFFGVNMGVYYDLKKPAIVPDSFLSLAVERRQQSGELRLSYVVWQEWIVPSLVLEVVSKTPGSEYDDKMKTLYYVIYNPDYWQRDQHQPFEVYRLVNSTYVRQVSQPVWMPEIGLGMGCEQGNFEGYTREWLYWYDQQGNRLPAPNDLIEQERRLREELLDKLRERGIDPHTL